MNLDTFWELVDRSRAEATPPRDQAQTLVELVAERDVEEIIEFGRYLWSAMSEVYRDDFHSVYYLLTGYNASEDSFNDFQSYVVSLGRREFGRVLDDPDSLADILPPDGHPTFESFGYVAGSAYTRRTGGYHYEDGIEFHHRPTDYPHRKVTPPLGEYIPASETEAVFPKLWQRFNEIVRQQLARADERYTSANPEVRGYAVETYGDYADASLEALTRLRRATHDPDEGVRQRAVEAVRRCGRPDIEGKKSG